MTTRTEALATITAESLKEHERLAELRRKDDLFYEPDPEAVYVCEMTITRSDQGMGYTSRSKYTQLFTTRDLAVREACEEAKRYLSSFGHPTFNTLFGEGKFEEALEFFQTHYSSRHFEFRMTQVRAS
jgi:hypothetical protein